MGLFQLPFNYYMCFGTAKNLGKFFKQLVSFRPLNDGWFFFAQCPLTGPDYHEDIFLPPPPLITLFACVDMDWKKRKDCLKKGSFAFFGAPEVFKDPSDGSPQIFSNSAQPCTLVKQMFRHGIKPCAKKRLPLVVLSPKLCTQNI